MIEVVIREMVKQKSSCRVSAYYVRCDMRASSLNLFALRGVRRAQRQRRSQRTAKGSLIQSKVYIVRSVHCEPNQEARADQDFGKSKNGGWTRRTSGYF